MPGCPQLPAVLEIILLRSTEMSAADRYTATTLTNYLIVIAGAVLVSVTIGVEWSKLQWLIAALGVGIGFGLQEIVANFISGLMILFELAREDERVLEEPPAVVVFDLFADSSLNLGFRVFVGTLADRLPVITDMHREINRRFAEAGITIAFPQRDLHMDTLAPLKVEVVGGGQAAVP